MTAYPLNALLRVRHLREQEAEREVLACTHRVEEAQKALQARRKELQEYTVWRIEEEKRLFAAIRNTMTSLKKIDEYKQKLLSLRGKEAQYQERILLAEKHLKECETALEQARRAHMTAVRERNKIEQHTATWHKEGKIRVERTEEQELEDFTPSPRSDSEALSE